MVPVSAVAMSECARLSLAAFMLMLQRIRQGAEMSAHGDHKSFGDGIDDVNAAPASVNRNRSQSEVSEVSRATSTRWLAISHDGALNYPDLWRTWVVLRLT